MTKSLLSLFLFLSITFVRLQMFFFFFVLILIEEPDSKFLFVKDKKVFYMFSEVSSITKAPLDGSVRHMLKKLV